MSPVRTTRTVGICLAALGAVVLAACSSAHQTPDLGVVISDETVILERFERNQPLIRQAVLLADQAFVYDNSRLNVAPQRTIAFRNGAVVSTSPPIVAWAARLYRAELLQFEHDGGRPG